jgi:probable HAF family extracellular repeat protein
VEQSVSHARPAIAEQIVSRGNAENYKEKNMNSKTWMRIITLTLFAAALALPLQLAAQGNAKQHHPHQYHHYQLNDVGTFGGPNSTYGTPAPGFRLLNNRGTAVGGADTATADPICFGLNGDCYVSHGFKWQDGVTQELDALPGFNGLNGAFGFWASDSGLTAGFSENGIDPLTGGPAIEAVLWGKDGSLTDLGTFGGNDGASAAVNNRGQVAGVALNAIPDPYTGQFLFAGATQAHAFLWTRSAGLQDLGTLGGADSAAYLINQPGQIAGQSFTNTTVNPTTGIPTLDPFFWDKTAGMIDLGTLGGTVGQAFALNNRGQVVGQSNTQGDAVGHAFLWDKTAGMRDLGTLGGEDAAAIALNDAGDVVGQAGLPGSVSCDQCHAFLWRKGVMSDLGSLDGIQFSTALSINASGQIVGNVGDAVLATLWEDGGPLVDLNTLIPSNPGLVLFDALYINDSGEIAAQGTLANGDFHSFVLIPCDENHPGVEGCDYSLVDAAAASQNPTHHYVPSGTQRTPRSRWTNRYRIPGLGTSQRD